MADVNKRVFTIEVIEVNDDGTAKLDKNGDFSFIEKDYLSNSGLSRVAKEEQFFDRVRKILEPSEGGESLLKAESKEEVLNLFDKGKRRAFKKSDYQFTEDLKKLREEIKAVKGNSDRITNSILRVRRDIDNMNIMTLGEILPDELAKTVRANIGGYLTTEYKIFNRGKIGNNYNVGSGIRIKNLEIIKQILI